jgi:hypothetical protein
MLAHQLNCSELPASYGLRWSSLLAQVLNMLGNDASCDFGQFRYLMLTEP